VGRPADAEALGRPLGIDELRRTEGERARARQQRLDELRARFVDGPTLRLRPGALRLSFDPRGQVPLGAAGTVMADVAWRGEGGAELHAAEGALITPDWSELRLPLDGAQPPEGRLTRTLELSRPGWKLVLPAGWRLSASGGSTVAAPPVERRRD
jgi:hypothetical protein